MCVCVYVCVSLCYSGQIPSSVYGMCFTASGGCWDIGYIDTSRFTTPLTYLPIKSSGSGSGYYAVTMTSVVSSGGSVTTYEIRFQLEFYIFPRSCISIVVLEFLENFVCIYSVLLLLLLLFFRAAGIPTLCHHLPSAFGIQGPRFYSARLHGSPP